MDINIVELKKSLAEVGIMTLRQQFNVSVDELISLGKSLGRLIPHFEKSVSLGSHPEITIVSNLVDLKGNAIGLQGCHVENFHSDLSWKEIPADYTILLTKLTPSNCGDTLFLDSSSAYDDLSPYWKMKLEHLEGYYCYLKKRGTHGLSDEEIQVFSNCAVHPLITTHPISMKKAIYANPADTSAILGLSSEASEEILSMLFNHTHNGPYISRYSWKHGDLLIWDNRSR